MAIDYCSVTELSGDKVGNEQVERLYHRYCWAGHYCQGKDVVEVACGTGQGVGYLSEISKSIEAGDYSESILSITRKHYGTRFTFRQFDAMNMPFDDYSKDVIIMFEAIYYIPDVDRFVQECARVLRPGGKVLIATANKDLYDFNPSPYSYEYFGVVELKEIFRQNGFSTKLFGYLDVSEVSLRQRMLRPLKKIAVFFNLIPRSTKGKKLFKRFIFGKLVNMPAEIDGQMFDYNTPTPLDVSKPDKRHKVLYCSANKKNKFNRLKRRSKQ